MSNKQNTIETPPIDVVITWVDGNASAHKAKMQPFLNSFKKIDDFVAGTTRYTSVGEIYYCVASILRFAPFVRKLFIVTDQQDPQLDRFVARNFPTTQTVIELVDHTTIFKGYEEYLPTFNSLSIESMLYRIPDLSDYFVYFNDDFFLVRPLARTDWVKNSKIQAVGTWRNIFFDNLLRYFKPKINGKRSFGYKHSMIKAAKYYRQKLFYFHLEHTPHVCYKPFFELYYHQHESLLTRNVSFRFRDEHQYNPQALLNLIAHDRQRLDVLPTSKLLYIKPVNRGESYVKRKLTQFRQSPDILFCCIGSLDEATEADRTQLLTWLKELLQLKF